MSDNKGKTKYICVVFDSFLVEMYDKFGIKYKIIEIIELD